MVAPSEIHIPTPVSMDNYAATGIIYDTDKQKLSWAIDIIFFNIWLIQTIPNSPHLGKRSHKIYPIA